MPSLRARVLSSCCVAFVGFLTCASASYAAPEKIVYEVGGYSSDPSGAYEAFVDSSAVVTQQLPGGAMALPGPHNVALSPNGQMIAFGRNGAIYTENLNTGQEKLVYSSTCSSDPRFTPDAKALFFDRNCDSRTYSDIWRVNVDGTGAAALITWGNQQTISDVSSDG